MKKFLLTTVLGLVLTMMVSLFVATPSEARSSYDVSVVQVREGDYEILPEKSSNYALDVAGGGNASKETWIQLYERNDSDAQIFTIERVKGEWYRIVHKRTGYVVNVAGGHDRNSEQIQLYKDDGSDSCYWRFLELGNGSYIIQSKLGDHRVLDLSDNKTTNGRKIQLWDYHTNQAARWVLSPLSNRHGNRHRYGYDRYDDDDDDDRRGYGRRGYGRYDDDDDDDDYSDRHRRGDHRYERHRRY